MSDAQSSLKSKINEINVENLIVVVVAEGFYHDDGEAIIFEDRFVLLDTFIDPVLKEPRQCKYRQSIFNSFEYSFRR